MKFEILGDISDVETFATGSGIREIARLSARGFRKFDWLTAPFVSLSFIGTRQPESAAKNSR
jgi:hypothetical protein